MIMNSTNGFMNIPLPKGYTAGGINCGVRRYRPDLGLLLSETPSTAVAALTQNSCKAAPILYCEKILPAKNIRAIITNSGQANAATGDQGIKDNHDMAAAVATQLGCEPTHVLTASTGVIGEALQIDKIRAAIPDLLENVSTTADKFALSILTTDLVPKWAYKTIELSNGCVHITGICKGSGMIHPNMATMLGYIVTDAALSITQAQAILNEAVGQSFNMISVDGETSTNDAVFLLANGASGVAIETHDDFHLLQSAIMEIAILLAKSIVRDGEGASKCMEVRIRHAPTQMLAKQLARSLTSSPLIKSAVYGESSNWGRVLARLGMEGLPAEILKLCSITFQNFPVFHKGAPLQQDKTLLKEAMKSDTIFIDVDLASGAYQAVAWGCDLSERYVKINAEYAT